MPIDRLGSYDACCRALSASAYNVQSMFLLWNHQSFRMVSLAGISIFIFNWSDHLSECLCHSRLCLATQILIVLLNSSPELRCPDKWPSNIGHIGLSFCSQSQAETTSPLVCCLQAFEIAVFSAILQIQWKIDWDFYLYSVSQVISHSFNQCSSLRMMWLGK